MNPTKFNVCAVQFIIVVPLKAPLGNKGRYLPMMLYATQLQTPMAMHKTAAHQKCQI